MTDDLSTDSQYIKSLGTPTDAVASISADEDGTARSSIGLWKAVKNLLIDIKAAAEGPTPAGSAVLASTVKSVVESLIV